EAKLRRAASASGDAGDLRVEGIFEGVRGAVLAALDRIEESRCAFSCAEVALAKNGFFAEVIAIHRGHLDLAEARAAERAGGGGRGGPRAFGRAPGVRALAPPRCARSFDAQGSDGGADRASIGRCACGGAHLGTGAGCRGSLRLRPRYVGQSTTSLMPGNLA